MNKLEAVVKQFNSSVDRLKEVLDQEKNAFMRDSAIKRFEFTFDLSWKVVKAFMEENKGVICKSPKECFREAYKQGFIAYDDFWIEMADLRNKTAHTYKEQIAEEVYAVLPKTLAYFQKILESVNKERTDGKDS